MDNKETILEIKSEIEQLNEDTYALGGGGCTISIPNAIIDVLSEEALEGIKSCCESIIILMTKSFTTREDVNGVIREAILQ